MQKTKHALQMNHLVLFMAAAIYAPLNVDEMASLPGAYCQATNAQDQIIFYSDTSEGIIKYGERIIRVNTPRPEDMGHRYSNEEITVQFTELVPIETDYEEAESFKAQMVVTGQKPVLVTLTCGA